MHIPSNSPKVAVKMSNEAARSADSFSPLVWFLIKKFISASGTICPQSFQTIDTVAMLNYQA